MADRRARRGPPGGGIKAVAFAPRQTSGLGEAAAPYLFPNIFSFAPSLLRVFARDPFSNTSCFSWLGFQLPDSLP